MRYSFYVDNYVLWAVVWRLVIVILVAVWVLWLSKTVNVTMKLLLRVIKDLNMVRDQLTAVSKVQNSQKLGVIPTAVITTPARSEYPGEVLMSSTGVPAYQVPGTNYVTPPPVEQESDSLAMPEVHDLRDGLGTGAPKNPVQGGGFEIVDVVMPQTVMGRG